MEQTLGEQYSTSAPALVPAVHFPVLAPLDKAFESIGKGGTCWLPRWIENAQGSSDFLKRVFLFHLRLSVASLTDVNRMNLAGRAAWRLSRCFLPSDVQAAAVVAGRSVVVVVTDVRLNNIEAARCNRDSIVHPLRCVYSCCYRRTNRLMKWHSFFLCLKLGRKLECFLSRSMGPIETSKSGKRQRLPFLITAGRVQRRRLVRPRAGTTSRLDA